jgi:hypothetical protein
MPHLRRGGKDIGPGALTFSADVGGRSLPPQLADEPVRRPAPSAPGPALFSQVAKPSRGDFSADRRNGRTAGPRRSAIGAGAPRPRGIRNYHPAGHLA